MTNMDVDWTDPDWTDIPPSPPEPIAMPPSPLPRIEPIPEVIVKALSNVMGNIKKLSKGDTNQWAKWNYTSADTFFEAVGPLMAAEGLVIIGQQAGWDIRAFDVVAEGKGGYEGRPTKRVFLQLDWDFYLAHSSGALWMYPLRRTIMSDSGGAQKWGGAQTYVTKQFLRALLLIPTGEDPPDKDADKTTDADAERPWKMTMSPPQKKISVPKPPASPNHPPAQEGQPTQPTTQSQSLPMDTGKTVAGPTNPAEAITAYKAALVRQTTHEDAFAVLNQFRKEWDARLNKAESSHVTDYYNKHLARLAQFR
jgi:hypothetical protein